MFLFRVEPDIHLFSVICAVLSQQSKGTFLVRYLEFLFSWNSISHIPFTYLGHFLFVFSNVESKGGAVKITSGDAYGVSSCRTIAAVWGQRSWPLQKAKCNLKTEN
ncbi:hypothetical protein XENOCAPTIV_001732 [Xenoophorus captivus]|uniref:Uncharacterized protein n=1 Tax=Xenoophorus captivus TaxID=1517983 RepID=A0ABV0RQF2_9TELE